MLSRFSSRRHFVDLSDQEVLALAISSEEDDSRIYRGFAGRIRAEYPATAAVFDGMAAEEETHAQRLIQMHKRRFGDEIPLIRREHVADFYNRKPVWLLESLSLDDMRKQAAEMEQQAERFYRAAAQRTTDADTRALLNQLAAAETAHEHAAEQLAETHLTEAARDVEAETAHRQFVLTWVQPGLAGLMDGSVSTLAPIFAAAFATTFLRAGDFYAPAFFAGALRLRFAASLDSGLRLRPLRRSTMRFSPITSSLPVTRATAKVSALPIQLPGPSQYSTVSTSTSISIRFGSSLPRGKNAFIASFQNVSIRAWSRSTRASPATER